MNHPVNLDNAKWLGRECFKIFHRPVGVAGGFLDAVRGWKFSRSWLRIWFHLPSFALLIGVYLIFGFSTFSREDVRLHRFSVESQKQCETKTLEAICNQSQEEDFSKAIGIASADMNQFKTPPPSELTKRYVELLSKRILSIEPRDQEAHYRLGLIYSITGQLEAAEAELSDLANGKFEEFPQANAWMAKELLKRKVAGVEVPFQELLSNLEKASKWKAVDYRLISLYARVLDESGETLRAIAAVKKAALTRPDLNLDLARFYFKTGSLDELKTAAALVEDVYLKRLNSPQEQESDRLAVAEVRKLTNRLEQAAEVLTEGLRNKSSGPATKRALSEIQRLIYAKSIHKTVAGPYDADISLLEKVVETDPSNPNISYEIAKLLPLKIKPSKKLLEVLRQQVESGIASAPTYILLAEGYFAFGKIEEAVKNWEFALIQEPNHIGTMNNLAVVLAKLSDTHVDRSLSLLNKALSLSPANSELLDSLGDVYLIAKKPKEAINKYELAIRNDPSRLDTQKKLLGVYQLNGMHEMANTLSKEIEKKELAKAEEELKLREKSQDK